MNKDLDGIQVVTLEQAVAAPYASGKLAQAGARVIKVEREEGDFARKYDNDVKGLSAYFVWLNHGKESVCLNIKDSNDLNILIFDEKKFPYLDFPILLFILILIVSCFKFFIIHCNKMCVPE